MDSLKLQNSEMPPVKPAMASSAACQMCGTQTPTGAAVCPYCGNDLATDGEVLRMIASRMSAAYRQEEPVVSEELSEEPSEEPSEEVLPETDLLTEDEALPMEEAPDFFPQAVTAIPVLPTETEATPNAAPEENEESLLTPEVAATEAEAPALEAVSETASDMEPEASAESSAAEAEELPVAVKPEEPAAEPPVPEVVFSKREMKYRLNQIAKGKRFAYAVTPPPAVFPDAPGPYPVGYEKLQNPKDPMLRQCLSIMQDDVDCLLTWMRETGGTSNLYDPIELLDDLEKCEAYLVTLFSKVRLCNSGDRKREAAYLAYCKRQILKGYSHCMAFKERNLPLIEAVKQHYAKTDREEMLLEK